jgi:predicted small lipoprotein YifL
MKKTIRVLFAILSISILAACTAVAPVESPPDGSPPPATIEINGAIQVAGVGSFCWNSKTSNGASVDMCADKIGLPTLHDPLISSSPVTAHLILPINDPPKQLGLSVFQATADNEVKMDAGTDKFRYWMPAEGVNRELALQTNQEITLELKPGLYVFYVFAVWEGKGDVSYGFLVEVQ